MIWGTTKKAGNRGVSRLSTGCWLARNNHELHQILWFAVKIWGDIDVIDMPWLGTAPISEAIAWGTCMILPYGRSELDQGCEACSRPVLRTRERLALVLIVLYSPRSSNILTFDKLNLRGYVSKSESSKSVETEFSSPRISYEIQKVSLETHITKFISPKMLSRKHLLRSSASWGC